MALRHSEEIERRLRPEEARAFLQVHAEREAAATADAPTVEDLAEALGLTPVEARSILCEARVRAASPRPRRASPEVRIASILLACGAISIGCLLFGTFAARPAPPIPVASERLASVLPIPVAVPEPLVQPVAPPAPPSYAPPALSYVIPPAGFRILVNSPAGTYGASGPTTGVSADYGRLGSYESASVRSRLVATCLDLIDSRLPPQSWNAPTELNLSIALHDGRWTKLVVPVGAAPTHDDLQRAIGKVLEIAWPQIVRSSAG